MGERKNLKVISILTRKRHYEQPAEGKGKREMEKFLTNIM